MYMSSSTHPKNEVRFHIALSFINIGTPIFLLGTNIERFPYLWTAVYPKGENGFGESYSWKLDYQSRLTIMDSYGLTADRELPTHTRKHVDWGVSHLSMLLNLYSPMLSMLNWLFFANPHIAIWIGSSFLLKNSTESSIKGNTVHYNDSKKKL